MLTNEQIAKMIKDGRDFMKMPIEDPDYKSDQELKKPQPPLCKAALSDVIINLPNNFHDLKIENDFLKVINTRQSHRVYTQENMSLLELSYLLWTTQGVKEIRGKSYATLRTVPCGGARHEFEMYMVIKNVEGLKSGYYHYLPMTHQIELLKEVEDLNTIIGDSLLQQLWAVKANVVFYSSMVAYRAEWRYGVHAHRVALMDCGYIYENLYLACTSIGLGTCAIGAVDTPYVNEMFGLDGEEEFIICAAPVGTVSPSNKDAEQAFYAFVKENDL